MQEVYGGIMNANKRNIVALFILAALLDMLTTFTFIFHEHYSKFEANLMFVFFGLGGLLISLPIFHTLILAAAYYYQRLSARWRQITLGFVVLTITVHMVAAYNNILMFILFTDIVDKMPEPQLFTLERMMDYAILLAIVSVMDWMAKKIGAYASTERALCQERMRGLRWQ